MNPDSAEDPPKTVQMSIPPSNETQAPAALAHLAVQSIARSVAALERGGKHQYAVILAKHFATMLFNGKDGARGMIQEAKGKTTLNAQDMSADDNIAFAEREFTYAILRLENAIKAMPYGTNKEPHQKHLNALKGLRAAYAKRQSKFVNAIRDCI